MDYAIFIALAILDKESDKICHPDNDFSDILKVNKIYAYMRTHTHTHAHTHAHTHTHTYTHTHNIYSQTVENSKHLKYICPSLTIHTPLCFYQIFHHFVLLVH